MLDWRKKTCIFFLIKWTNPFNPPTRDGSS